MTKLKKNLPVQTSVVASQNHGMVEALYEACSKCGGITDVGDSEAAPLGTTYPFMRLHFSV